MILKNIELIQFREMNCEEAVIATVANHWNRNYEMIFSEILNLIKSKSNNISDFFYLDTEDKYFLLEKYHGIKQNIFIENDFQKKQEIIYYNLKNNSPVCIIIKGSLLSWYLEDDNDKLFPFLVIGYDNKYIYCIDIHLKKNIVKFEFIDFWSKWNNGMFFTLTSNQPKHINWKEHITLSFNKLIKNNIILILRDFAKLINDRYYNELEIDNFLIANLSEKFKLLCRSRYLYCRFLQYINKIHRAEIPSYIIKRFQDLSDDWFSLWGLTYKNFLTNKKNILPSQISNKILLILEKEEITIYEMKNFLNGKIIIDNQVELVTSQKCNIKPCLVNIEKYFNNEAFAFDINKNVTSDLTGFKQFLVNEKIKTNKNTNFLFNVNHHIDGQNDNICCENQVIILEKQKYSSICFLGCAEWGHQSGELFINYENNKNIELLKFSDVSSENPYFNEIIFWTGKCMERKGEILIENPWCRKAHLFVQRILLDKNKNLVSIKLPDCINMHIFAITLY